jgi:hypothetical protein
LAWRRPWCGAAIANPLILLMFSRFLGAWPIGASSANGRFLGAFPRFANYLWIRHLKGLIGEPNSTTLELSNRKPAEGIDQMNAHTIPFLRLMASTLGIARAVAYAQCCGIDSPELFTRLVLRSRA